MEAYYAHSGEHDDRSDWQPLRKHLRNVAKLAYRFAWEATRDRSLARAAYTVGLLHDIGKYSKEFRKYLIAATSGKPSGKVAHAPVAAAIAQQEYGQAMAYVIAGHHQGLPSLNELLRYQQEYADAVGLIRESSYTDTISWPSRHKPLVPPMVAKDPIKTDVFIRMLFSCLIDADWCDTHAWKTAQVSFRSTASPLAPLEKLQRLRRYVERKKSNGRINALRRHVFESSLHAATGHAGFYTLTVPTGGGKTLASLAFALKQCAADGHQTPRRIIYVIPYLNILEQSAKEFRKALEIEPADITVFEHHSLAYSEKGKASAGNTAASLVAEQPETPANLRMEENWDSPIIATTSVQFFESLFANRPSAARKLHNIARSVVIFDECQTFPTGLYRSMLSMLQELVAQYGVSFVFCTATQPALLQRTGFPCGIPPGHVTEIVSDPRPQTLFAQMHYGGEAPRVHVSWPGSGETSTWEEIAKEMRQRTQSLAIVNLKKHAYVLYSHLASMEPVENIFHLSTLMCSAHRRHIMERIKVCLQAGRPCFVAATQLVEAGVDIDFPTVFRAMGPLDSIAQAAGRCNREGTLNKNGKPISGEVIIFHPQDSGGEPSGPPGEYEVATRITLDMLSGFPLGEGPDIFSPDVYKGYFQTLLSLLESDKGNIETTPQSPRQRLDFPKVAELFRLIKDSTYQVVVPYIYDGNGAFSDVLRLMNSAASTGYVTQQIARQLQPFLVNLWPHDFMRAQQHSLVQPFAKDWWQWIGKYSDSTGLLCEPNVNLFTQ